MFAIGDEEWAGTSKLIEEMGELNQVLGKLMGSRGKTNHWSGDLRQMLVEEIADVRAAIEFFEEHNLFLQEQEAITIRTSNKLCKFEDWHETDNQD